MKFRLVNIKYNGYMEYENELLFEGLELQCVGNETFVIQNIQTGETHEYDNGEIDYVWSERYTPQFVEAFNVLEFSNWFSQQLYAVMDWEVFHEALKEFYTKDNNTYTVKRNIVHNIVCPTVQYLLQNSYTNELRLYTDVCSTDKFDAFEFAKFADWFSQQKFSEMSKEIFFEMYHEYHETLNNF